MNSLKRLPVIAAMAMGCLWAQPSHYSVKLRVDFERRVLVGVEDVQGRGVARAALRGGKNLTVTRRNPENTHFEYEARQGQGLRWQDDGNLVTMFHCGAWMVCDAGPGYRATLRLEIVIPKAGGGGRRAVGPGRLTHQFRSAEGEHFVFEVARPVQSYLFSFMVARLERTAAGNFEVWSVRKAGPRGLTLSAEMYRFFRAKARVDWLDSRYVQAFGPVPGAGQEAAGMALMSQEYLDELESRDEVELMAHEMAHQWWAVLVGIESWSDFWLNEGITEFMTTAFVEHHQGRAAYDRKMDALRREIETLRAEGKDRPLHWEQWTDAVNALGPVPYRKGALFMDRLRRELGETAFWRGLASYTRRYAGKLADSRGFQQAMEEAAGRPLTALFEEGVYR